MGKPAAYTANNGFVFQLGKKYWRPKSIVEVVMFNCPQCGTLRLISSTPTPESGTHLNPAIVSCDSFVKVLPKSISSASALI